MFFLRPKCSLCEQLRQALTEVQARLERLELERAKWVTEATIIIDDLTALENRQRMRVNRVLGHPNGSKPKEPDQLDLADFKFRGR